jgi:exonuclease III
MCTVEPLSLLSLNANGLGDPSKRRNLICWLNKFHNSKSKFIFLQETHCTNKTEIRWKKEWDNRDIEFSNGDSGSRGVAIIFPKNGDYKINEIIKSKNGRYIAINITIDNKIFCLINCYVPNKGKLQDQLAWLAEIQQILVKNSDTNIIVGGDLNDHFIPKLDKYKCKLNEKETEYVKAWKIICEEFNLVDLWRLLNPYKREYTWRQGSSAARLKQSRLDYWLTSLHMIYDLDKVGIQTSIRSDHSLINLSFYKSEIPSRGPSFWRFNASLLRDPKYVEMIKTGYNLANEKYQHTVDKGLKWDLIKMELRSSTICFSKTKAKETRETIKEVILNVERLEKEISDQASDENLKEYNDGKKYIENYNNEKANGIMLRSKTNWIEHGERNTKFFLNLEKRNYQMKCITKLIDDQEKEINEPNQILEYEESFYKNLYSIPEAGQINEQKAIKAKESFLD